MIEPIMYVAIGFLVACMLVIGIIPLVHARAVRLTMRRLEKVTPMSMAEIQADKDQLRAEFAMSTRRLEMSVEQMKAKTTSQLAEIGKKSEAIGRLKLELGEKTAALFALEAKEKQLTEELHDVRQERDAKASGLQEAERQLTEARSSIATLTANLNEASITVESQRVELATLHAQTEVLKGQIESYDKETQDLHDRLNRTRTDADTTTQELTDERAKTETLGNRVAELERQLVAQTTEAEILGRRVQELLARLDEQGRFLAEREYASDVLRNEAAAAKKNEADLRAELAEAESRRHSAFEALQTERNLLENQLRLSQQERTKLQDEIAAMKREAETAWASERMENAVMRERINDVAAEVARLTSVLEGPGSPIEAILASDAARTPAIPLAPAAGHGDTTFGSLEVNGGNSKGSLADRIRALQNRASRVPQPSRA
jgi:chromosome segregation ATPase